MASNNGSSAPSLFGAIDVALRAVAQSGAPRRTVAATAAAVGSSGILNFLVKESARACAATPRATREDESLVVPSADEMALAELQELDRATSKMTRRQHAKTSARSGGS